MAMTPERKVKKDVVKVLDNFKCYYTFPVTSGFGASGVPDILVCHCGVFIAIECKAGSNQPTKLQQRNLERIKDAGGIAIVINETNLDTLEPLLRSVTGR